MFGEFEFDGSSSRDDLFGLDGSPDDHNGIVERPFCFCNELFSPSSKDDSTGFGLGTVTEEVVPFCSDLFLFETATPAQHFRSESIDSSLDLSSHSLQHSLQVVIGYSPCTEESSVCEVLGSQVSDRQFGEDDLSTTLHNLV